MDEQGKKQLVEPISIATVEALEHALLQLDHYHDDSCGVDEDGTRRFPCPPDCLHCQTIHQIKQSINEIYTDVGAPAPYPLREGPRYPLAVVLAYNRGRAATKFPNGGICIVDEERNERYRIQTIQKINQTFHVVSTRNHDWKDLERTLRTFEVDLDNWFAL